MCVTSEDEINVIMRHGINDSLIGRVSNSYREIDAGSRSSDERVVVFS
jgi:hypothetical protein